MRVKGCFNYGKYVSSVYSICVLLSISVSVQVAQWPFVRVFDLWRVVNWRPDELEDRLLHACKDQESRQEMTLFIEILLVQERM